MSHATEVPANVTRDASATLSADAGPGRAAGLRRRYPIALLLVAMAAALFHMVPFWIAQTQTPQGWEFTGVLSGSPDALQYRMLTDRSQEVGPIVDNRLTTEPNEPHVVMLFYWGIGKLAGWLDVGAGFVYEYAGALFAFVLVLGLFRVADHFMGSRYQTWWVFLATLIGGGLGAHILFLNGIDRLRGIGPFRLVVTDALQIATLFEQYRNHYIFSTLLDSHFLFFLLMALGAVMAYYAAVARFSVARLMLATFMFGAVTVLHIYDGVTLVAITGGVVFVLWLKRLPVRPALLTGIASAGAVGAAILWQLLLYERSGLEIPTWRAQSILFIELALAYALAWALIAWGLGRYWRTAGLKECFLLGWALGCTLLTLSGPFYPYPDRGNLTLQIPLFIIAGAIYFAWRPRVSAKHALIAVAILAVGPLWRTPRRLDLVTFAEQPRNAPRSYMWLSPDHQALVGALRANAGEHDVLIVDKTRPGYMTDDLWLTLGYPGLLYAGHYAVTPEFERKRAELTEFYTAADASAAREFLERERITFVYVAAGQDAARFAGIPGLHPLVSNTAGTLFRYSPEE